MAGPKIKIVRFIGRPGQIGQALQCPAVTRQIMRHSPAKVFPRPAWDLQKQGVLIPVEHILRESEQAVNLEFFAVVENNMPGGIAEHLVLVGFDDSEVRGARAVDHRLEVHLETPVV